MLCYRILHCTAFATRMWGIRFAGRAIIGDALQEREGGRERERHTEASYHTSPGAT
jgi:hypothetical protein